MRPPVLRPIRWVALLAGAMLSALGLIASAGPLPLAANQRIERVDVQLRRQGWKPHGDPLVESLDRELAGSDLSSLRSCSGTGAGFCRYDYRRGRQHLQVITVPGRDGDGLVHHWLLEDRPGRRP
jgi:hypothetical protein